MLVPPSSDTLYIDSLPRSYWYCNSEVRRESPVVSFIWCRAFNAKYQSPVAVTALRKPSMSFLVMAPVVWNWFHNLDNTIRDTPNHRAKSA
ncbi:hypothetical protein AVEN_145096-1 [Araneus ventricosus]|uniref:Uncharacterized protein n=1 Tax=Araneus ventricosus TaxID=182803 RepID=A0A4Y2DED9_ARAVE|nr:hypothetical protein AVEN_16487-1 [Araneus ventricosus]GBM13906.1 hypothetical protein AVEN_53133-1 [Araneus ventricosus]GBM13915.1 hypothetical protein AVEN_135203-1 [Araneus ventricosus]GBM13920.1 hypothetical protein AVEN_145096-1 [Araneus ventricosus]